MLDKSVEGQCVSLTGFDWEKNDKRQDGFVGRCVLIRTGHNALQSPGTRYLAR